MTGVRDDWSSGDAYEPYVGRWSRLVAAEFLSWLHRPPEGRWLDVGSGTGALSAQILQREAPRQLHGVDSSAGYVDHARRSILDARARFEVGDAQHLRFADGSFDTVVSGLVLNFVPDRPAALREMGRVARPHGVVAAYVWDYPGEMQLMRYFWDTAVALDASAAPLHEGQRFAMCQPEPLADLFRHAGFADVRTRAIVVPTRFADFDDYWSPFLGGQAPAPSYAMSLPEERRAALGDAIRQRLPVAPDGSISLTARAWAVRGDVGPA